MFDRRIHYDRWLQNRSCRQTKLAELPIAVLYRHCIEIADAGPVPSSAAPMAGAADVGLALVLAALFVL